MVKFLRHRGCRFGVQPSGCTAPGRLKPELQTGDETDLRGMAVPAMAGDTHFHGRDARATGRTPYSHRRELQPHSLFKHSSAEVGAHGAGKPRSARMT